MDSEQSNDTEVSEHTIQRTLTVLSNDLPIHKSVLYTDNSGTIRYLFRRFALLLCDNIFVYPRLLYEGIQNIKHTVRAPNLQ